MNIAVEHNLPSVYSHFDENRDIYIRIKRERRIMNPRSFGWLFMEPNGRRDDEGNTTPLIEIDFKLWYYGL